MNSIPKGFFFFTEYAAVNYCEGSRVLCNVLISTQLQKKKIKCLLRTLKVKFPTHTIGHLESNTDTLTDENFF